MCLKSHQIFQNPAASLISNDVLKSKSHVLSCNDISKVFDSNVLVKEDSEKRNSKLSCVASLTQGRRLINDNILKNYKNNECFVCNQIQLTKDLLEVCYRFYIIVICMCKRDV